MTRSYNLANLKRHDVSIDEIKEVMRSPLTVAVDLEPSNQGNYRVMLIGFTFNLRVLEIGIEYMPNDQEHIFHAMDATKQYRQEFEKRTKSP